MTPPRRIAYLAMSADGYIADRHGQVGWLESFGAAPDFGFDAFLETVGALLMGRRTFDQLIGFGGAWPYGARPTIVLTHRALPPNAPASARAANTEEVTQAMAGAAGRVWIVGGGQTLALCLRRGLVDELQLFMMPILLGEGAPLSGQLHHSTRLALNAAETLPRGVVKLTYTPVPPAAETRTSTAAAPATVALPPSASLAEEGLSTGAEGAADDDPDAPFSPEANTQKDA
jgi:dihydrofolate reductase